MRVERRGLREITVTFTSEELRILVNSLNEVCNALDLEEFSTRMGAELDEVERLLKMLHDASRAGESA